MALEFNIDPALTGKAFVDNICSVLDELAGMVPDYELDMCATAHFSEEVMAAQPDVALELGCEPDLNAWTGKWNKPPNANVNFRTGAGHVHLGWTEGMDINDPEHRLAARMMGKQLDYALYLPSLLVDRDDERRKLYGKTGAIRIKPYGMEYRVLSNFWLQSKPLMRWVYKQCNYAFDQLMEGNQFWEEHSHPRYYDGTHDKKWWWIGRDHMIMDLCTDLKIKLPPGG
jgi:hypothetical protein